LETWALQRAAFSASAGQINTIAGIGRPVESNGPAYPAGRK
jgi:predicted small secreted protein